MKSINTIDEKPSKGLEPFLQEFHKDRTTELKSVMQALELRDFDLIRNHAHKWKGYSAPYGFKRLEIFAEKLEFSSQNENFEECTQLLMKIKLYLEEKAKTL